MIRRQFELVLCLVAAIVCTAAPASAQLYVSPYAEIGGGLLRILPGSHTVVHSAMGLIGGGGAMGFVTDRIGWRGDARYVRDLSGDNPIRFWRLSIGLVWVR